jgi:cysteine-rich repeat protein
MLVKTSVELKTKKTFSLARTVNATVLSLSGLVGISTFLLAMTVPTIPVSHVRAIPPSLKVVCGDGRVEGSEQCDPGHAYNNDGDGCSALCKWEWCGDGIIQTNVISRNPDGSIKNPGKPLKEQCDSPVPGINCTSDCQIVYF